jgi:hypothetical protein
MRYEFRTTIKRLLQSDVQETRRMMYCGQTWRVPVIAVRPPYYTHPRLVPHVPKL